MRKKIEKSQTELKIEASIGSVKKEIVQLQKRLQTLEAAKQHVKDNKQIIDLITTL